MVSALFAGEGRPEAPPGDWFAICIPRGGCGRGVANSLANWLTSLITAVLANGETPRGASFFDTGVCDVDAPLGPALCTTSVLTTVEVPPIIPKPSDVGIRECPAQTTEVGKYP